MSEAQPGMEILDSTTKIDFYDIKDQKAAAFWMKDTLWFNPHFIFVSIDYCIDRKIKVCLVKDGEGIVPGYDAKAVRDSLDPVLFKKQKHYLTFSIFNIEQNRTKQLKEKELQTNASTS